MGGLGPALAVQKQESSGDVSLSTGTGAVVPTIGYYGKREAEADPALVYSAALPYAAYPYAAYPYTYAVPAVKPLTLKSEVVATGAAVPVSVGGYKAVAGDNGDLKGAPRGPRTLRRPCSGHPGELQWWLPDCRHQRLGQVQSEQEEAEADPALVYSAYPYATYGAYAYGAYPYAAYGAYPYGAYGHTYSLLG